MIDTDGKYIVFLISFHKPDDLDDDAFLDTISGYLPAMFTANPPPGPVIITPLPAPTPEVFAAIQRALEEHVTDSFLIPAPDTYHA